ncbi:MAG: Vgb family protein, partial [Dehalococcoidia bacterium]
VGINHLMVELAGVSPSCSLRFSMQDPSDHTVAVSALRSGIEKHVNGEMHTVYEAPLRLDGTEGTWRGAITLPNSTTSGPIVMPISPALSGSAITMPPGPPAGWFVVVALMLFGAVTAAAARAFGGLGGRILSLSFGGAGLAAALVAGIALATASGAQPRQGSWGQETAVVPRASKDFQIWTMPTPKSGLMPPAIGPDGSVWVSEMDTNRLAQLVATKNKLREFGYGSSYKGTMGIAVDAMNLVWLAQESVSAIGRFDPATGSYDEFPTPTANSDPTGLAIDKAGNIWVTELAADKVGRFEPGSRRFTEYVVPTQKSTPYWLAVAPDGRVWFTELASGKVGVVDPITGTVDEYRTPNGDRPAGIAVDRAGTVWIGTLGGSLVRLEPGTLTMMPFRAPGSSIYGVAVGPDGVVWVGTTGAVAYSFDPKRHIFQTYSPPADSGPWWPAVGADGSVWVVLGSQSGNGLVRLTAPALPSASSTSGRTGVFPSSCSLSRLGRCPSVGGKP